MKNQVRLGAGLLTALLFSITQLANASETFNYQTKLPDALLEGNPSYITLHLFLTEEDTVPIASNTYLPGEWEVIKAASGNKLRLPLEDAFYLEGYDVVWAETEMDGAIVSSREAIMIVPPGISVGGLIESRTEGFKFPDASVQTKAGMTTGSPVVTTTEIVDGTITGADVNTSSNLEVNTLEASGAVNVDSNAGYLRFRDSTGATIKYYVYGGGTYWRFRDLVNSRYVLKSDANGIGIGTDSPGSTHAVTMPSLEVTGAIEVGLVLVHTNYGVTDYDSTCDTHGDDTCYRGSGTVACPVGKSVLGGGVHASAAALGEVTGSYPVSKTEWYCASTYHISLASESCYAICARLE